MSPQLPTLRQGGAEALDKLLHENVARHDIPAMFYLATNAKETIYANQTGEKVFGDASQGQIDAETYTEMFSQTKLITCIAALQLVDRGLVSLDSEADVEKHLPEVGELQLITGYGEDEQPTYKKPENKVTLRMLMSHSAGFVYAFTESLLSRYNKLNPDDIQIFAKTASVKTISKPLIFEPGTSFIYSTSIDWVGKLVERVSGQRLDAYFQEHIFDPLGCKTLTFFPTDEVKRLKMAVCARGPDGIPAAFPGGWGMGRPSEIEDVSTDLLLGGAGLFGNQRDYLTILRAILQSDPSSANASSKPLISAQSFKELFTGSIKTEAGRKGICDQVSRPAYLDPPATPDTVDHSVGFMLNLVDLTGRRKAGSGCWSGAAKTQFWIDPKSGIAAICATQLLSPAPDPWFAKYAEYEKVLYSQLE